MQDVKVSAHQLCNLFEDVLFLGKTNLQESLEYLAASESDLLLILPRSIQGANPVCLGANMFMFVEVFLLRVMTELDSNVHACKS